MTLRQVRRLAGEPLIRIGTHFYCERTGKDVWVLDRKPPVLSAHPKRLLPWNKTDYNWSRHWFEEGKFERTLP